MNERIRQLSNQAYDDLVNQTGNIVVFDEDFQQRFAELIVRECLKEIKDMIVDKSEQLYPNNKQTTECVNDRLMDAYDNIKELFRVES